MRLPLLLLPGMLCDHRLWMHQEAALPVLHGDITRDASVAAIAARVLAAAPPLFALAGLSMGGIVALAIVAQAPERVRALALLDTTARPDAQPDRAQQIALVQAGGLEALVGETLKPRYLYPDNPELAAIRALVMDMARELGADVFELQSLALMNRSDARPGLGRIACPTLVLCGAEDTLCPLDRHQEIAAAIPGARLEVIPACGHLAPLERPQPVTAALRRLMEESGCL